MFVTHLNQPSTWQCSRCGKAPVSGMNRPHSLHSTKRTIWPNLQWHEGKRVCTRCLKKIARDAQRASA